MSQYFILLGTISSSMEKIYSSLQDGDLRVIMLSTGVFSGIIGSSLLMGIKEANQRLGSMIPTMVSDEEKEVKKVGYGLLAMSALIFGGAFLIRKR